MITDESLLPPELLKIANLSGNEYAWRIDDIPKVIEAGRSLGLLNIGGQLQFRLANATCECYWIEIDTYKTVSNKLPWVERVNLAADIAHRDFEILKKSKDFIMEGKQSFPQILNVENITEAMYFVWYLKSEK